MFKIMQHMRNQHGFSVSLVKYENEELTQGFTLNSFKTYADQDKYAKEFAELTGYEIEKTEF